MTERELAADVQADVLLEVMMEHLQSAWIGLGTYSAEDRKRRWPMGTPQYHLQAAERAGMRLLQVLRQPLSVYRMYQEHVGAEQEPSQ